MQNGILQNSTSLYPICSLLPRLIEEFYLHLSLLFFRFFCSVKAALIVLLFSSSSFSKQNILSISLGAFGVQKQMSLIVMITPLVLVSRLTPFGIFSGRKSGAILGFHQIVKKTLKIKRNLIYAARYRQCLLP